MSSLGLNPVSREPVTTEWDDIQRKLGNLPPLESPPEAVAEDAVPPPTKATADKPPPLSNHSDEMTDEAEELARLRAMRLDELRGTSREPRFGTILPLSRGDYSREVNEAGDGVSVVVFLSKSRGHYLSSYTLVLLEQLARKFGDVKFMQIESTECIPDYPDRNLPTLLLYRDDDLLGQCVGAAAFGGSSFGVEDVEWELAQAGVLKSDIQANPHGQKRERQRAE
jgi:hypothetical protein